MSRKKLTDEELAAMPEHKRNATLRKRRQLERRKAERAGTVPPKAAALRVIQGGVVPQATNWLKDAAGGEAGDDRASLGIDELTEIIYGEVRAALIAAGTWSEVGKAGICRTYAQATAVLARVTLLNVPAHIANSQKQAAVALGLLELPADKVRARADRFGGAW